MIYEFSKDVQGFLAEKKYPVRVVFGPERITRERYSFGHAIVIEHDPDAGDQVSAPPAAVRNPRLVRKRVLGAKATIYARSSLPNAHRGDHERECEKIVDALIAAFYRWGAEGKVGDLPITKAGFIKPPEGPEVWPGVAYEIRFGLPRGVYDREYVGEQNAGAAQPTGGPTSVQNQTQARLEGGDPEADPDLGCGA